MTEWLHEQMAPEAGSHTLCAASAGLYETTYRGPLEAFTMTAD